MREHHVNNDSRDHLRSTEHQQDSRHHLFASAAATALIATAPAPTLRSRSRPHGRLQFQTTTLHPIVQWKLTIMTTDGDNWDAACYLASSQLRTIHALQITCAALNEIQSSLLLSSAGARRRHAAADTATSHRCTDRKMTDPAIAQVARRPTTTLRKQMTV